VIIVALVVASATFAAGLTMALLVRRLPTVRAQLAGLALLGVALPLAAVLLSGVAMFHMGADVVILAVTAASSTVTLLVAMLVARSISTSVRRLAETSQRFAVGDLAARASEGGPRELAQLGASFNEMARDLEELFDARRQLVAWASHDLRTPLASLQAMIEAIEDRLVTPDHYLPVMHRQVETLGALVDDLFELARIDAGVLSLELREATLPPLVESCIRSLEAEALAKGVRLGATFDRGAPAVHCAPEKIERVLLNLLSNALRHTPSDGAIAVRVEPEHGGVRVSVEDTGEGLEPDSVRRMFDRFWRGDLARSTTGGGLGLAIARGLIEAHGGRIWAEQRAGGGARVSFTLPAAAGSI
jgi:signal transduction histidine kinase